MDMITIALAKGRLAENAIELLEKIGIDCSQLKEDSRKLVFTDEKNGYRFILVKPTDVPTYVYYGVADIGVAGKDTLMESGMPLYEMLDLGFGKCRLCVCGFPTMRERVIASNMRVATKYPNIAREYFQAKGENVDLIKLNGSVELGPILGLSDVILDIVESGRTLKENGLEILEVVCDISARVVVNRVKLKTGGAPIKQLIDDMGRALEAQRK